MDWTKVALSLVCAVFEFARNMKEGQAEKIAARAEVYLAESRSERDAAKKAEDDAFVL